MKASVKDIEPQGIYTATQAIEVTGMSRRTFYNYLKSGKIRSHYRSLDGKRVYKGFELIETITGVNPMAPPGWGEAPKRGRKKGQTKGKETRRLREEASGKRAG